jgi:hypothetical protein
VFAVSAHYTLVRRPLIANGTRLRRGAGGALLVGLALALGGCSALYYAAIEQLGWEKRDVLVNRVEAARDSLARAETQVVDGLEQLHAVVQAASGDLAPEYQELTAISAYADGRAKDLHKRIAAVETAGSALFTEWRDELAVTKDVAQRARDQQHYDASRAHYERLLQTMRQAAASLTPVLDAMRDQVAFLQHNLTAEALSVVRASLGSLAGDADHSLRDLGLAIAEANVFIKQLGLT